MYHVNSFKHFAELYIEKQYCETLNSANMTKDPWQHLENIIVTGFKKRMYWIISTSFKMTLLEVVIIHAATKSGIYQLKPF